MVEEISPEKYIQFALDDWGFHVEKVPEAKEKRPDLYAFKDGDDYLIEVKAKEPSLENKKRRQEYLLSGRVFDDTYVMLRQSGLTKTVSEAKNQLKDYQPGTTYFRLICFVGLGHNAEARLNQVKATLYGSTTVGDWSKKPAVLKHCYYFGFSDFYNYRGILHGAILSDANTGNTNLCINDLSPRYREFKESSITHLFGTAAIDPRDQEREGEAYVVDSGVDRRNKHAVLDYIRQKYSLGDLVLDMDMKSVSVEMAIPKSDF